MSNEEVKQHSTTDQEVNEVLDNKIDKKIQDNFISKDEMSELVKTFGEKVNIAEFISHDCSNDDCGICKMKNNIDSQAFKRGVKSGYKLHAKYPNLKVD